MSVLVPLGSALAIAVISAIDRETGMPAVINEPESA
jgi:hypothetical protein